MDFITENRNGIYTIKYHPYLEQFLNELNVIVSSTPYEIKFKAKEIENLNKLNILFLENFIYDIGSQILLLKKSNNGVLYFSLSDIVIINSNHFLFINPNIIYPLSSHKTMTITDEKSIILENNDDKKFIAPELEKIISFPAEIYYTSSFYSLASLIFYVFNITLENIYYTKSYYFLLRCLDLNPNNRIFLYV